MLAMAVCDGSSLNLELHVISNVSYAGSQGGYQAIIHEACWRLASLYNDIDVV